MRANTAFAFALVIGSGIISCSRTSAGTAGQNNPSSGTPATYGSGAAGGTADTTGSAAGDVALNPNGVVPSTSATPNVQSTPLFLPSLGRSVLLPNIAGAALGTSGGLGSLLGDSAMLFNGMSPAAVDSMNQLRNQPRGAVNGIDTTNRLGIPRATAQPNSSTVARPPIGGAPPTAGTPPSGRPPV